MTDQTNTPELRFPEFKKEWQCNTLDNCCYKISDGIHSTPIYSKSGDFSFINGNNLINGKIHFENAKLVDSKEALKHKRNLTYNETILLSINGIIGNIALYRGEKIILGKSAAYINIKANFLNPLFLYYFLETNSLQRYFRSELTGTIIKNLSIKSIKKTKLYISNITEQRKIGDFFSKLDQQIELEEKKLELLEQQKHGYMQKIFSQELRFKDENRELHPE
ncbi:restriction endonuclease subunit S [Staphylococcus epidermidis]|uniref:Probable specificity determinant HsdS n=1 Tax=Staphylococcus epidermidis TaxID=1282 RepID=A0A482KEF9_STAEP|nr:restriction endonuclease subunit S [Staphylococcus epidermidis]MBM0781946.1 restriction endonuclease subunit S [Staphylococcus epidermidis]MBM6046546.1 restriction endonuclease subunit S [Staphylococcus epidermidis]MCT1675202.1 restriction endonuclease subunit S [Staphylococcus epidermidis]QBP79235.1 probable specificity determinant HsdS [Staphylococcus epidermidis]UTP74311.1 restriction endonuclease subunit S [Staphylococcus epidermidis]